MVSRILITHNMGYLFVLVKTEKEKKYNFWPKLAIRICLAVRLGVLKAYKRDGRRAEALTWCEFD